MKNKQIKLRVASAFLAFGLMGGLISCSKQEADVAPTPTVTTADSADVRVVEGRLVFKDQSTLASILSTLASKSDAELKAWDTNLNFTSLNKSTSKEAAALREEFGFPRHLTAVINPNGEYQVGNLYYYFKAGQVHEFKTQADMLAFQQNQTVEHRSAFAGRTKVQDTEASRSQANSSYGRDGKYQYDFCLWNDCGSRRKIVFERYIYTQGMGVDYWYTALVLAVKLEFRNSKGQWRVAGEQRVVDLAISGDANSIISGSTQPWCSKPFNITAYNETNYDQEYTIADCYMGGGSDPSSVYWDFSISGRISSWVSSDQGHTYTENKYDLW
ncbi:hypothetical protein [Hymenobacter sp. CRA2]|uniref:hypothetical protein n=1 Tax=Hymenobacter sp. CRA2 TaxID=1955620 RepID=UPI00098F59E9|nr:hypothetical protein [Hymenobacter sp. CRA2]OON70059.1 hypothetical protein B0919_04750 [Hymenobacter sp. CRA2]